MAGGLQAPTQRTYFAEAAARVVKLSQAGEIRTCIDLTRMLSVRAGGSAPSRPKGAQMTQAVAQEQNIGRPVSLAALFTAFLLVSLYGVGGGGGIVWARGIAVEKRR